MSVLSGVSYILFQMVHDNCCFNMKFILFLLIAIFAISCSGESQTRLETALALAGDNRQELEKVLTRYRRLPEDSLKYRAAVFLIENMPGHYYYEGEDLENHLKFYPLLHETMKKGHLPVDAVAEIREKYGDLNINALQRREDIHTADSAYLCENIEWAFKVWEEQPWGKNVSFEDFCRYILPYRVGDEALPVWREKYYREFNFLLDSLRESAGLEKEDPISAALCLSDALLKPDQIFFTTFSPGYIPHVGPDAAAYRSGSCRELSDFFLYVCRALGIPCAIDYMPVRGDDNVGHSWVALWDKDRNIFCQEFTDKVDKVQNCHVWDDAKSKVYRQMFCLNREICEDMEQVDSDGIAEMFRSPYFADVTELYSPNFIERLKIPAAELYPGRKPEIIYLCLSSYLSWIPVDYAVFKRGRVVFEDLDRGYIMRLASVEGDMMRFWTDPFYIKDDGTFHLLRTDGSKEDIKVLSRFPLKGEDSLRVRMVGGVFEGSDDPTFETRDTLFIIKDVPQRLFTSVRPVRTGPYRYIRYFGPENGYCNVAEVSFIGPDGKELTGKTIGTHGGIQGCGPHEYTNVFDGFTETSFYYSKAYGGWAGLDFGNSVQVDRIIYTPRNWDNYIKPGCDYELFYCDKYWKSAGVLRADSDSLVFRDVPTGVLYFLKIHSEAKQNRIFRYCEGRQIWGRDDEEISRN